MYRCMCGYCERTVHVVFCSRVCVCVCVCVRVCRKSTSLRTLNSVIQADLDHTEPPLATLSEAT